MNKARRGYLMVGILSLVVLASYAIVFLDQDQILFLCQEDGPIETAGALCFLLGSFAFLLAFFWLIPTSQTRRRRSFFILALVLFVCFGEEISWGQRLFRWKTPDWFLKHNAQKEISIHNLRPFKGVRFDGDMESSVDFFLNLNRLFLIFWLLLLVPVPLASRYSPSMNSLFDRLGIPVAPLWFGALFLCHAIEFHMVYNHLANLPPSIRDRLNEIKETNYALIIFVLSMHFMMKVRRQTKAPSEDTKYNAL